MALDRLNGWFEEAVRLHGGDAERVARAVKARIETLSPGERAAIEGALEDLLAFRAPEQRRGRLH